MKPEPLKPFIVGIDPGSSTGVCFWRRSDEKVIYSGTQDFYTAQVFIGKSFKNDRDDVQIFIEQNPEFMYDRNDVAAGTIRDKKQRMQAAVRREAQLLALCLKGRGFKHVALVPPVRETKWTQEKFELYTGSKKRTNGHERDAVRLAVHYANWRPKFR